MAAAQMAWGQSVIYMCVGVCVCACTNFVVINNFRKSTQIEKYKLPKVKVGIGRISGIASDSGPPA